MRVITIIFTMVILTTVGFSEDKLPLYADQGKRDPMWPLVTPGGTIMNYDSNILLTDMTLEGIILGDQGDNLAIINGVIVKQNEKIGLYTIKDITNNSVVLNKGNDRFMLHLKKEE